MTRLTALLAMLAAPALTRAEGLKAAIDPLAAAFLNGKKNAAVVVGVYRDGKPHVFGYGKVFLRTGEQTPAGDTIFAIGSITKGFTGVLLADAVRRGEVKLDAPANDYLPPDLRLRQKGDKPITLGHLATHMAGLPVQPWDVVSSARDKRNAYAEYDRKKLSALLAKLEPERAAGEAPPGKDDGYSNLGAGLVGHALVHAAKAPSYDWLLRERVCRPLGLFDTTEALTGEQFARLARGHTEEGEPGPHWDFATLSACGGLRASADDLLRFAAAAVGDTKTDLAPALAASMKPRHKDTGLFWSVLSDKGKPWLVDHNGGTYVTSARLMIWLDLKTAVVVLSSRGEADDEKNTADELAEKVLTAVIK